MRPLEIVGAIGIVLVMSACASSSLSDPDGQSSTPVVTEPATTAAPANSFETYSADGTTYIRSDCPAADPIVQGGADGLPHEGQTDPIRVASLVEEHRASLLGEFNAVDVRVVPRNGQVWTGPGNGVYEIVEAEDDQIEVILTDEANCPDAPYSWNGIPLLFTQGRPPPDVSTLDVDESIPLRVLAVRPNNPSLAVLDFETGTTTVYPPGSHALPLDATDGAVMTPDRDLIIWTQGVARLFSGSLDRVGVELGPNPPRSVPGIAPALRAIPTPDGDQVWLFQPGLGWGAHRDPTLVDLVSVAGGGSLLSMELDPTTFPSSASGSGLVIGSHRWLDTGDGYVVEPGSEFVNHLRTDGTIDPIGPGQAIASSTNRVARLTCRADKPACDLYRDPSLLIVTDIDGGNPVEVTTSLTETWASVGGPMIPSDAMPFQTVSPDGTELLVRTGQDVDVNGSPAHSLLVTVDLISGTVRTIAAFEGGTPSATWSADGEWIALITHDEITLVAADDPTTQIALHDVIPEDHFPLAAG